MILHETILEWLLLEWLETVLEERTDCSIL